MTIHYEKYDCENCQHTTIVRLDEGVPKSPTPTECANCEGTRFLVTELSEAAMADLVADELAAQPQTAGQLAQKLGLLHEFMVCPLNDLRAKNRVVRDDVGDWRVTIPQPVSTP